METAAKQTNSAQKHTRAEVIAAIRKAAFVPIVRVRTREQAMCAAEGIVHGGFSLIEMTLTIPGALGIIEETVARFGKQLIVGAGTVLDPNACRDAIAAGASFIVSPSTDPDVIAVVRAHDLVCMPGAQTPTEVFTGWRAGADMIKIFPAGFAGGPAFIRALKEPFPHIELVPSNGVDRGNAAEYLQAGATAVGIGGLIFDRASLDRGDVKAIASNAQQFARALRPAQTAL